MYSAAVRHPAKAPGPGGLLCARRASPLYPPLCVVTSFPVSGGCVRCCSPPPQVLRPQGPQAPPTPEHEQCQRPTASAPPLSQLMRPTTRRSQRPTHAAREWWRCSSPRFATHHLHRHHSPATPTAFEGLPQPPPHGGFALRAACGWLPSLRSVRPAACGVMLRITPPAPGRRKRGSWVVGVGGARAVLCALQGILPVKTLGGGVVGVAERVAAQTFDGCPSLHRARPSRWARRGCSLRESIPAVLIES
jgi:hypothetical protein